ncbi:DNA ligase (ATP) [Blastocladiella emersonii ATCC 22665]|nr:DNA ligase (ATP) [Blastocladiella emersonii ATCC 22665]
MELQLDHLNAERAHALAPLTFTSLVKLLEALRTAKDARHKAALCESYLGEVRRRKHVREAYMVLRMLLPPQDRARGRYNLKEAALSKAITLALNLEPKSADATKLKYWKSPTSGSAAHGDLPAVALEVVQPRSSVRRMPGDPGVFLLTLDAKLDALAAATSFPQKDAILKWSLDTLLPVEFTWFLRIILKDLKLGISERTVLAIWHPDAFRLWTTSSDLETVAKLIDPETRVAESDLEIAVMTPFYPMLGFKADDFSILPARIKKFATPFYSQEKVDGERITLHYKDGQFRFYSRKITEWTEYGTDANSGSWTRHVGNFFRPGVKDFVLDGEMVAVDTRSQEVLPFGTLRTAQLGNTTGDAMADSHPRFYVFDLLYLNGKSLIRHQLRHRLAALNEFFVSKRGWLEILPVTECTTPQDVLAALIGQYHSKGEGLVVKDPDSMYIPGDRPHCWLKVKIDYEAELLESMDLAIIGASWGEGRRDKRLSHFLLGLRDPGACEDGSDRWRSFCRVGSGYSLHQLDEMNARLQPHIIAMRPGDPDPAWVQLTGSPKERADVLIHPDNSLVLEVLAAEIISSGDFAASATLRFPRVRRVRNDKGAADAMVLGDVVAIWDRTMGRLVRSPTTDLFDPKRVRRNRAGAKLGPRRGIRDIHSGFFQFEARDDVAQVFAGRKFLVHIPPRATILKALVKDEPAPSDFDAKINGMSSHDLHKLIQEHGGKCIANLHRSGRAGPLTAADLPMAEEPDPDEGDDGKPDVEPGLLVVTTTVGSFAVQQLIKGGHYDVIHARHIARCVANKRWVDPVPEDMLSMTGDTNARYMREFDEWGDNDFAPIKTNAEMKQLLDHMDNHVAAVTTRMAAETAAFLGVQPLTVQCASRDLFAMPFAGTDRDDALAPYDARTNGYGDVIVRNRRAKWKRIEQVRARYFNDSEMPLRWFAGMVVYPHWYAVPGRVRPRRSAPELELAVARLVMYGAEVTSDIHARAREITHILIEDSSVDVSILGIVKRLISIDWVSNCCDERTKLAEYCSPPRTRSQA